MAEGGGTSLEGYDEDVTENPFFKTLQTKFKELYEDAASKRWMICVPRKGTTSRSSQTQNDIQNHILILEDDDSGVYKTFNKKEVQINGDTIVTTRGFCDVKTVKILFEETFFNSLNESYRVLCVDQPFEGGDVPNFVEPVVYTLQTYRHCYEFLWSAAASKKGQKDIDHVVNLFNTTYHKLESQSLRHMIDAANAVFTRAMQTASKEAHLRKLAKTSKNFMENMKLAVETYVLYGIYRKVFKGVGSIVAHEDAALNKITRNLAEIQPKDLDIKPELAENVRRARRQVSTLNSFCTPLEKILCVKRTIVCISDMKGIKQKGAEVAVTADDLLPVMVFLIIKCDMANWLANLAYMKNFHFSRSVSDEFQFYLVTIEAALEHVRANDITSSLLAQRLQMKFPYSSISLPWQTPETAQEGTQGPRPVEKLFQLVAEGKDAELQEMLQEASPVSEEKMCHPLCSCDKCESLTLSRRNDPAAVTIFSRDDMGRTALHVAAEFGHVDVIYTLICKGAIVNAIDYNGNSPLHLACSRGNQKATLLLAHFKADVNAPDNDGNTPLHLCVGNGHEECAKALVYFDGNDGVLDLNAANENGDTPLHLASRWGYEGIIMLLLENEASVEARNRRMKTPIHCAHNSQVSALLLEAAATENSESDIVSMPAKGELTGMAPLGGKVEIPRQLTTEEKKRKEEVDSFLHNVAEGDIHMVCFKLGISEEEEEEIAEDVIDAGTAELCHPLCQCEKCIKFQVEPLSPTSKVDINCCSDDGITALHIAALRGFDDIVRILLKHGAFTSPKNLTHGQTPLHLACQYNHSKIVSSLLQHGAKPNVKDRKGNTPLHFCCTNGHLEPALVILKHVSSTSVVNVFNERGNTPLHEAARWNFVELVKLLLEYGASVTLRNKNHLTPLQYAQHDDVVKVLETADTDMGQDISRLKAAKPQKSVSMGDISKSSPPRKRFASVPYHPQEVQGDRPRAQSATHQGGEEVQVEHISVKDVFAALENQNLEHLKNIVQAVRSFDRRSSLRRTETLDRSAPLLDSYLQHQLSIQHFDHQKLRRSFTVDKSKPMLRVDEDNGKYGSSASEPEQLSDSTQPNDNVRLVKRERGNSGEISVEYHKEQRTIGVSADTPEGGGIIDNAEVPDGPQAGTIVPEDSANSEVPNTDEESIKQQEELSISEEPPELILKDKILECNHGDEGSGLEPVVLSNGTVCEDHGEHRTNLLSRLSESESRTSDVSNHGVLPCSDSSVESPENGESVGLPIEESPNQILESVNGSLEEPASTKENCLEEAENSLQGDDSGHHRTCSTNLESSLSPVYNEEDEQQNVMESNDSSVEHADEQLDSGQNGVENKDGIDEQLEESAVTVDTEAYAVEETPLNGDASSDTAKPDTHKITNDNNVGTVGTPVVKDSVTSLESVEEEEGRICRSSESSEDSFASLSDVSNENETSGFVDCDQEKTELSLPVDEHTTLDDAESSDSDSGMLYDSFVTRI